MFLLSGPMGDSAQRLDQGAAAVDERGVKRSRRARALAWSAAGLISALLLIVGSLAALNGEVLDNGSWSTYSDDDGESIVLAPPGRAAGTGGVRGPVEMLAQAEEPSPSGAADDGPETPLGTGGATTRPQIGVAGASASVEADAPPLRVEIDGGTARVRRQGTTTGSFRVSGDADSDGLSDRTESRLGTDPRRSDSDGDEIPDGWEVRHGLDPADQVDGQTDADGDGLWNRTEYRVRSNPRAIDTDANGRPDGLDDTDGDLVPNGVEQSLPGLDPTAADSNADGRPDGADDGDGDGLPNATEVGLGSDPGAQDTNGDGQPDGSDDTDGDGVPNSREVELGLDPGASDSNGDGQADGTDDTDGDGRSNAEESAPSPIAAQPEPVLEPAP